LTTALGINTAQDLHDEVYAVSVNESLTDVIYPVEVILIPIKLLGPRRDEFKQIHSWLTKPPSSSLSAADDWIEEAVCEV